MNTPVKNLNGRDLDLAVLMQKMPLSYRQADELGFVLGGVLFSHPHHKDSECLLQLFRNDNSPADAESAYSILNYTSTNDVCPGPMVNSVPLDGKLVAAALEYEIQETLQKGFVIFTINGVSPRSDISTHEIVEVVLKSSSIPKEQLELSPQNQGDEIPREPAQPSTNQWTLVSHELGDMDFDKELYLVPDKGHTSVGMRLTFDMDRRICSYAIRLDNDNGNSRIFHNGRSTPWAVGLAMLRADGVEIPGELLEGTRPAERERG
jgi:hypothetical protein